MAKVSKGRISGVNGMTVHTSAELRALSASLEHQALDSRSPDDPEWLRRRAARLSRLAEKKEQALDHKKTQTKRR